MKPSFLAIDVGNSSIKWGLFDQGVLLEHFRLDLQMFLLGKNLGTPGAKVRSILF